MKKPQFSILSILAFILTFVLLSVAPKVRAQQFGFGDGTTASNADNGETTGGLNGNGSRGNGTGGTTAPGTMAGSNVRIGGELTVAGTVFVDHLDQVGNQNLGDLSTARLNFNATESKVEATVHLKLSSSILSTDPSRIVDEALLRFYLGPLTLDGGVIKATWGRADSQDPLDVINPLDLSDLTITDTMERKIGRPMIRMGWALGALSKLEGIFLPNFTGNRIDLSGRWIPEELLNVENTFHETSKDIAAMIGDTSTLNSAQGGLRFTTTTASVDWGVQYFYGFLPLPSAKIVRTTVYPYPNLSGLYYNRYHQAALDAATVAGGFNLRAEGGANVTDDLGGDKPDVYNPALVFSLGFDRDTLFGINVNLQYHGTYRLMNDKVGPSPFDIEANTAVLWSRVTAVLSQSLLNDLFSWKLTGLWGVQDQDYLIIPRLAWKIADAELALEGGIFGGSSSGQLGWYGDNDYIKVSMDYKF